MVEYICVKIKTNSKYEIGNVCAGLHREMAVATLSGLGFCGFLQMKVYRSGLCTKSEMTNLWMKSALTTIKWPFFAL